ncbi:MAG: aldolase [candidate division NC10 bacterium]|nr:aldolase [candidate division NC10 bacterium]
MNANNLRSRLAEGRLVIGMMCQSGAPSLVEIMGLSGFDFVIIDMEHGDLDAFAVVHLVRAAETVGMVPFIRVLENSPTLIMKALGTGAQGVVVPHVNTREQAERAVAAARFAPEGTRGVCPATRAAGYSRAGWDSYHRRANQELMVIPIVEEPEGLQNLEAILTVPGIALFIFGPGDLSQLLGVPLQGFENPIMMRELDRAIEITHRVGAKIMITPQPYLTAEYVRKLVDRGVDCAFFSTDHGVFYQACAGLASIKDA